MVFLILKLENPFIKGKFQNIFCTYFKVYKHKFFEFQITYYSSLLLEAEFSWTFKQDHAGVNLILGILGFSLNFKLYDSRHWCYTTNSWEKAPINNGNNEAKRQG